MTDTTNTAAAVLALQTIAEYPVTKSPKNMDAANMRAIAQQALAALAAPAQAAPAQAGDYPELPDCKYARSGDIKDFGWYDADQMRAYVDADRAARGAVQAAEYVKELDKLSQRNYELRMENAALVAAQAAPVDAENFLAQIDELVAQAREDYRLCYDQIPSQRYADARERIARAVLAKWGAPAPASQPVALPAGLEPVTDLIVDRFSTTVGPLPTSHDVRPYGTHKLHTVAQVQAMLARGLAPGWQAVPVEPTSKQVVMMAGAILHQQHGTADTRHPYWPKAVEQAERAYRAMLAAAPSGPAREPLDDFDAANEFTCEPHTDDVFCAYQQGIRFAERHHGITAAQKGGQHGG